MPINVNCTSFRQGGDCLHQAAPRRWFGPARCIVWLSEMGTNSDPRQVRTKCALCTPHPKPHPPRPVVPQPGWSTVEGVAIATEAMANQPTAAFVMPNVRGNAHLTAAQEVEDEQK